MNLFSSSLQTTYIWDGKKFWSHKAIFAQNTSQRNDNPKWIFLSKTGRKTSWWKAHHYWGIKVRNGNIQQTYLKIAAFCVGSRPRMKVQRSDQFTHKCRTATFDECVNSEIHMRPWTISCLSIPSMCNCATTHSELGLAPCGVRSVNEAAVRRSNYVR